MFSKKNVPKAEDSNNGNKEWFLHIFQTWLVKQSGEDTLRKRIGNWRNNFSILPTSMMPIWDPRPRERSMQKKRQDQMGAPGIWVLILVRKDISEKLSLEMIFHLCEDVGHNNKGKTGSLGDEHSEHNVHEHRPPLRIPAHEHRSPLRIPANEHCPSYLSCLV